ncbi:MAG: hypothetical protein ACE5JB_04380 [bacterium]
MRAENTQEKIAEMLDIGVMTVNDILKKYGNGQMSESVKDLQPYLYNIWNTNRQDNDSEN